MARVSVAVRREKYEKWRRNLESRVLEGAKCDMKMLEVLITADENRKCLQSSLIAHSQSSSRTPSS